MNDPRRKTVVCLLSPDDQFWTIILSNIISILSECSFEQKSRTKCVHHIVQQEKKKNGNRSSTVQQQLSDSHSGPRRNISDKNSSQYTEVRNDHFLFIGCLGNPYLEFKWVIENKNVAPKKLVSFGTFRLIPYIPKIWILSTMNLPVQDLIRQKWFFGRCKN